MRKASFYRDKYVVFLSAFLVVGALVLMQLNRHNSEVKTDQLKSNNLELGTPNSAIHLEDANLVEQRSRYKRAKDYCQSNISKVPGNFKKDDFDAICGSVEVQKECFSREDRPIVHYQKTGNSDKGKRILVVSLIHGDEHASGTVATQWIRRLLDIDSRNTWRVIPVANPDGWARGSRVNAAGVDVNRNFPSEDWERLAHKWWEKKKNKNPRRYPGPKAASEPETRCVLGHIDEFNPDFIISIHTPLGILDFDGPDIAAPSFAPFPWQRLGTYPGSLGRYMWKDKNVPVLTIELKRSDGVERLAELDLLQDISGSVAIRAGAMMNTLKDKENKNN